MYAKFFVAAILATYILAPGSVSAATETFDCRFRPEARDNGWLMKRVVVRVDPAAKTADALDGIIYDKNNKKPLPAKFRKTNAGAYKVSWAISDMKTLTQAVQCV